MLKPVFDSILENRNGQDYIRYLYRVFDTDRGCTVETAFLKTYSSEEECQEAINFYNAYMEANAG